MKIYSVNDQKMMVFWKNINTGSSERSKMVRINDSTLVWSYRKENGEAALFYENLPLSK